MNQFENRYRPKWYQTFLFVAFCTGIVYAVLVSNPYLYSGITFEEGLSGERVESLFPVPRQVDPSSFQDIALPEPPMFLNWSRSSVENSGETRDRRYNETESFDLQGTESEEFSPLSWIWLQDQLVAVEQSGQVHGYKLSGERAWSLALKESETSPFLTNPISDGRVIYFVHPKGRLLAFDRTLKKILWSSKDTLEYLSDAFLFKSHLFVLARVELSQGDSPSESQKAVKILKIDRRTGEVKKTSNALDAKAKAHISFSIENQILFLSAEERLLAVQLPEMKVKWQKVLSSPIEGPPVVATKNVLVSLQEGKVKGYNMLSGKEAWDEDLKSPLQGQPTYVPIYNRAVAISKNGYLHVVDLDSGDRLWRFQLDNQNDLKIPWTARLTGKFIEELQMKWKYKGWTVWSPCVQNRICIYNPSQGQIVGRVMLSGNLQTQPLFEETSFRVVLKTEKGFKITKYEERGWYPTPKPSETSASGESSP